MSLKTLLIFGAFLIHINGYAQMMAREVNSFFEELETLGESPSHCIEEHAEGVQVEDPGLWHRGVSLNIEAQQSQMYEGLELSVIDADEAQRLFDLLNQVEYMPTKYLNDGCYARAHELALIGKVNGLTMGKAFSLPAREGGLLYPEHLNHRQDERFASGFSGWRYHTAAFVLVKTPNGVEPMVFDIGVASGPQTMDQWRATLSSRERPARIVVRDRAYIYQEGSFRSPDVSIIPSLLNAQNLIDEIGMDEYLFRLERGWL